LNQTDLMGSRRPITGAHGPEPPQYLSMASPDVWTVVVEAEVFAEKAQ
jgi:hypothetical protein